MFLFKIKLSNKKKNRFHIINKNIHNKNNCKLNSLNSKYNRLILNFRFKWMIKLASSKKNKMHWEKKRKKRRRKLFKITMIILMKMKTIKRLKS